MKLLRFGLLLASFGFVSQASHAVTYYGCYECVEKTFLIGPSSSFCAAAYHGDGWKCVEDYDVTQFCVIEGSACTNPDYVPPGSGSGAGQNCQGGPNGCPANCFTCSGGPRPRI